jgi:hypothetical protein
VEIAARRVDAQRPPGIAELLHAERPSECLRSVPMSIADCGLRRLRIDWWIARGRRARVQRVLPRTRQTIETGWAATPSRDSRASGRSG